ncbi:MULTISPECIES: hypothetical protein [unclassified Photobacterium]|uniref:hypothetical protein n=1 Tax=unclassified Photobacterium TaxID=2628852 RepID=UPI001EDE89F0|nr:MULTISPECIES: hypothetical protein [unclassified Photobacterium]MCG3865639.1 hypothetical protein [Photobacterium sp. Ph6]MCG3877140.1 hypothetical protein [Photobacterium sp. Ph5]
MSYHCKNAVYIGDKYCVDCGDALNDDYSPKDIIDINPTIFDKVKKFYPNVYSITGIVESTYYYKRGYRSSKNDIEYSYIWIVIKDKNGKEIQTSIPAESDYLLSIEKGQVVTLYYPNTYTLTYNILSKKDKKFVIDNSCAPCIFIHLNSEQRVSSVNDFNEYPSKNIAWMWFFVLLIAAITFASFNITDPIIILILSVCVGGFAYTKEKKVINNKFDRKLLGYEAVKESVDQILSTNLFSLGYEFSQRAKNDCDIFCSHCHKRVSAEDAYCFDCGGALFDEIAKNDAVIEFENTDENHAPTGTTVTSENEGIHSSRVSFAEIEKQIMEQHYLNYEVEYEHEHVYSSPTKKQVTFEFYLGQIINKNISNDVSDVTEAVTTKTETKHYYGSTYTGSTYRSSTEHYRTRSSTLSGKVSVRVRDGNTYNLNLPESMLASSEMGDWLLFSDREIKNDDDNPLDFEYIYNINKDIEFNGSSFTSCEYSKGSNIVTILGIILVALSFIVPALLLIVIAIILFSLIASLYKKRVNYLKRKEILMPIKANLASFKADLSRIKTKLIH